MYIRSNISYGMVLGTRIEVSMNTLNILKQIIVPEFGTMSLFACLGALLIMLDLEKLSKFCFIVSLVFLFIMVLTAIGYMWVEALSNGIL